MTESKRLYTILVTCLLVIANDSDIEAAAIGEGLIIRVMDRMVYVDLGLQDNIKKGDSQNILREFKSKGLIPGDSYCANEIRFVSLLVPNYNFTQLDEVSFENLIKKVRTNPLAESKKPTFTSALSQCASSGFFHMCFGTRIYDHGEIYVGEWIDDLSHGQGRLTYRDGSVEEGYWERGEFTMVANLSLPRCPTSLNVSSWDNCNGGYSSKSGGSCCSSSSFCC